MKLQRITDTNSIKYVGKSTCRYITPTLLGFLAMSSSYINNYNDLDDPRLFVGNGQDFSTQLCSGNPAHTGYSVDVNYYTQNLPTGQTPNATHYISTGMTRAQIWEGQTFIPERFNFGANWALFNILNQIGSKFGTFVYRTSDIIRQEFQARGFDTTGMQGDFEFKHNHHIHAHLDLFLN